MNYVKNILSKYKKNIKKLRSSFDNPYIDNRDKLFMDIKKKIFSSNTFDFFSKEMIVTKKSLNENQLKYTYQKQLISDLDYKHKEWSKFVNN